MNDHAYPDAARLNKAFDEVHQSEGFLVLGLRSPKNGPWTATIGTMELKDELIVHQKDPCAFTASDEDAPTAIRLALTAAKKATGV